MNTQDNREANNQPSVMEDLSINADQATTVKGGHPVGDEKYVYVLIGTPPRA
jgi:hypothetical protein